MQQSRTIDGCLITESRKTLAITTLVGIAHIISGIAALYVPNVLSVAPLAGVFEMIRLFGLPDYIGGILLFCVGSLAVIASTSTFRLRVAFLIPQQLLLILQIWSISVSLVTGVYPDGYIPQGGPWFILTDQIWAWMLTVSHSAWLAAYVYQGLRKNGPVSQGAIL